LVALPNLASLPAQDTAAAPPAPNETPAPPPPDADRLPVPDDASSQNNDPEALGTPYYRDAQGRFFSLDPQGQRVYVGEARWERRGGRTDRFSGRLSERLRGRSPANSPAKLGVMIRETDQGVQVAQVQDASVAAAAGLQSGDIVRTVNGEQVDGPEELQRLVQGIDPGQAAQLTILRNGETQQLNAQFPSDAAGDRYNAAKPPVDDSNLQQEVQQLREDVQSLRQQMKAMQKQMKDDSAAPADAAKPEAKRNAAADATDATRRDSKAAEAADEVSPPQGSRADTEQAVRLQSNEKAERANRPAGSNADGANEASSSTEAEGESADAPQS
jgi:membrane-associated protease RseP (regulator of RpoE activity)